MRKSLSWSKSRLFGINRIVVLYCKCSFWARTLLCFVWLWKELEAKLLTPGQLLGCHWKLLATGGIQSKKNEKLDFLQLGFLSPGQIMIESVIFNAFHCALLDFFAWSHIFIINIHKKGLKRHSLKESLQRLPYQFDRAKFFSSQLNLVVIMMIWHPISYLDFPYSPSHGVVQLNFVTSFWCKFASLWVL